MKILGLLGGMSWESGVEYERLINRGVRADLGGTTSADLVIRSFNFHQIATLQAADKWDEAGDLLGDAALSLQNAGAEAVMICANTMHLVADRVTRDLNIPLIHIVDVTAGQIQKHQLKKVLLLGTRYTMEQDFFKGRLARNFDIEALVPSPDDIERIHSIIYCELVRGIFTDESKAYVLQLIDGFIAQGVQGVIAGCTEIELLVREDDVNVPYFPTLKIHAEAAVDFILDRGGH